VVAAKDPAPAGAVIVVTAVTVVAVDATAAGTEVDVPSVPSVVLSAVQRPKLPPASPAPSNPPVDPSGPSDLIAVGGGKSPRVKNMVGVMSVRRGKIALPVEVESAPVVATKKDGDEVVTNDRSPNVIPRMRPHRPQRKTTMPLAKDSGRPLLRRRRALTTPKPALAKEHLRLRNGDLDGGAAAAAAGAAKKATSVRNRVAMSRRRFPKKPDSSRRKTPPMTDSERDWTMRLAVGRKRNVRAAMREAVRRAASDPNAMTAAAATRVAKDAEGVGNVRDEMKKPQVEKNANRDGDAARKNLAATRRPLSRSTTVTSRPGRKRSPISICHAVQAVAAAVVVDLAAVVAREEAVVQAAATAVVVAEVVDAAAAKGPDNLS
jgi:hypothetical protein